MSSLKAKLLLAHLLLIAVGTITFLLAAGLAAPGFFETHLNAMGSGAGAGSGSGTLGDRAALLAAFQASVTQAAVVAAAAGGVAAVLASLFISARIAGPVGRMASATRRIAAGNYSERVRLDMVDPVRELTQLADSFNDMAAALEGTERRRAELLGDLAHELRTPISTLEGYMEGLLDGIVEPSPETWARLHDEAGRLRRLVDDLSQLSRLEAHQLSLSPIAVDPADIVGASLELLRPRFLERGLEVVAHVPGDLPQVRADRDRAVQVLNNLLTNALRYTPSPGRVELSVYRAPSTRYRGPSGPEYSVLGTRYSVLGGAPGGKEICFRIADTGIGIAAEHLPHLFERFYRVDKSRSRAAGGSGIGLTIAKALVEAMGGRIWADSPGTGKGSAFTFTLPIS